MDFIISVIGKMCGAIVFLFGAVAATIALLLMGFGLVKLIGVDNLNPIVALLIMGFPLGAVVTWAVISTINDSRW